MWWRFPDANIGMPTFEHRWVLDADPRNGGDDSLRELEKAYGPLPRTVTAITGGGGNHFYWGSLRQPWPAGKIIIAKGIDIQNLTHYVALPPSIHPDTHRRYEWESDFGPDDLEPQPPPEWLEGLILKAGKQTARSSKERRDGKPIAGVGERIPDGMRENTITHMLGAMRATGATVEEMRAAAEAMNLRCDPPLEPADLDRIAESMGRYEPDPPPATLTAGGVTVSWGMPPVREGKPPVGWSVKGVNGAAITEGVSYEWQNELYMKKNGELLQNVTNIKLILQHHPHWHREENVLWWDSVRGRPMCGDVEIDETLMLDICDWLGRDQRLPVTTPRLVEKCVITQCRKAPRDLLQLWLSGLPPWDGVPRLTTWLQKIAGVPESDYARDVSRVLPVSMVARAMNPGCHYRFVVIFEGEESIGKTALVRALATPEWYVELAMNLDSKEAHMMLQGVWVAELSELDALTRTEETRLKAFITLNEDSYIPKFSNLRDKVPRRAIFIGTTNEESYLKGQSGNTRYLPIRLPKLIDLPLFAAMREQLFAEALAYYSGHPEDWWQLSDEANQQAKEEREHRRRRSVYEDSLANWLDKEHHTEVWWELIAVEFLSLPKDRWSDRRIQMEISASLGALGWRKGKQKRISYQGKQIKVYPWIKP
jgi:hypothetical protein